MRIISDCPAWRGAWVSPVFWISVTSIRDSGNPSNRNYGYRRSMSQFSLAIQSCIMPDSEDSEVLEHERNLKVLEACRLRQRQRNRGKTQPTIENKNKKRKKKYKRLSGHFGAVAHSPCVRVSVLLEANF